MLVTKLWVPCLVIAFLFMQYQLWFMPGGLMNAKKTNQEIAQLEQKNNAILFLKFLSSERTKEDLKKFGYVFD